MKALIVYGGWDGHEPEPVSEIIEKALVAKGFKVEEKLVRVAVGPDLDDGRNGRRAVAGAE